MGQDNPVPFLKKDAKQGSLSCFQNPVRESERMRKDEKRESHQYEGRAFVRTSGCHLYAGIRRISDDTKLYPKL